MNATHHVETPVVAAPRVSYRPLARILCSLVMLLALGGTVNAQDVNWRTDYARALKEAAGSGKPLFVDVGTENCYWCKQLDLRTFKDAELVAVINERCVPLKINANESAYLVQALRVQSYPTLVFASSDGTILKIREGFLEAPALRELMVQVLSAVGTPDWMQRDFESAQKAITESDHARAIVLLRNVVDDGKDRPVQQKARKMLDELEKLAAKHAEQAKELAKKGQTVEAIAAVNKLRKNYPGTPAAREGKQLVMKLASRGESSAQERKRHAEALLKRAREDYRSQLFTSCLDRCEILSSQYADLEEGREAEKLAADLKSNPEWTRQACEQLGERLSLMYLSLADTWLKKGQPQQATYYLERVMKMFPGSRQAEMARVRLARLRGGPAMGEAATK
jgi:thioredoxin-related protein/outer membrane protein assembly factor BamD (BamD/ComL family)